MAKPALRHSPLKTAIDLIGKIIIAWHFAKIHYIEYAECDIIQENGKKVDMVETNNAARLGDMPRIDGHHFEDAVQALEKRLADGVKSALNEPSYTVDELKQALGI